MVHEVSLTQQQAFELAFAALWKQNERCLVDGVCRYRGTDGTKCAVGHLIPDEDYEPEWDNRTDPKVTSLDVIRLIVGKVHDFRDLPIFFLQRMQQEMHDELSSPDFRRKLLIAAKNFAHARSLHFTQDDIVRLTESCDYTSLFDECPDG